MKRKENMKKLQRKSTQIRKTPKIETEYAGNFFFGNKNSKKRGKSQERRNQDK